MKTSAKTPLPQRRFTPAALYITALALVAVGAVALLLPAPALPMREMRVVSADSTAPRDRADRQARGDSLATRIVNSNLFSASRRAPRDRFVLPGQEPVPSSIPSPMVDVPYDAPVLQGVMVVDGVRRALLRFPGTDSVPRIVVVGERVAGYRVRSLGSDRVELSSSGGTRTVRLVRRSSADSLAPELR